MNGLKYFAFVGAMLFTTFAYHQGRGSTANLEQQTRPAAERDYTPPALPPTVHRLYGNRPVFIGGQLDASNLDDLLYDYGIEHVVDLAAEKAAEDILTNEAEQALCTAAGATYYPLNIEGRGGRMNGPALTFIDSLVDSYAPIFIHCRHGEHRAKLIAARAYARDGWKWGTIIDLLHWGPVVRNPQYDRYTNNAWAYAQKFNYPVTK